MALSASSLLAAIDSEISGVKITISEGDPRKMNQALVALQLAINQMEPIDSPVNAPSAARIKARQNIQTAIEPIKNELIALTHHSDSTVVQTASTVLGSAAPSIEVYNALKGNLENTKSPGIAASSLLALSKSGLMDDEIGAIAADRIEEYQSGANPDLALNLIRTAAFVPVPQAANQLIEIIKSDDRIGAKMTAANAIMKLGPDGEKALPELEKLLQELEQKGGDFRDINTVKRAITLVSGRSDIPRAATPKPAAMTQNTAPISATTLTATPRTSASPTATVAEEEPASTGLPIVPVVVLVAVIVGVAAFVMGRRSRQEGR